MSVRGSWRWRCYDLGNDRGAEEGGMDNFGVGDVGRNDFQLALEVQTSPEGKQNGQNRFFRGLEDE